MAWSWSQLNAELSTILDDGDSQTFSAALRLYGCNAALKAMSVQIPEQSKATITNVASYAFPSDLYSIVALQVNDTVDGYRFLEQIEITPGNNWPYYGSVTTTSMPDGYWIWNKTIYFGRLYSSVDLYYKAYYTTVTASTTDIPIPSWAQEALVYWIAAYCLNPTLVTRARLGMWHDKKDAPPLENPLIQAAVYYRQEFTRIMNMHHGTHQ